MAYEICHCTGVTDDDIKEAYKNGAKTWEEIQEKTQCSTGCGGCLSEARHYFESLGTP